MSVIGKSVIRDDALSKAEGKAKFVADIIIPDMLHAAVLRSPHAHALIKQINDQKAREYPGVEAILWAKDIPAKNVVHVIYDDQPLLAGSIVKYIGEPIAVIAAIDEQTARHALNLIEIKYESLSAVTDFEHARDKQAPQLYKDQNTFAKYKIRKGDVNKAFSKAAFEYSGTFFTPYQEHAYLETQGMIVVPEKDGLLVIGAMQCPFYVQGTVADVTGLSLAKVQVKQAVTGGGFGGKEDVPSILAGHTAILAYHLQKPVRLIYRRDEDMISMSKRHPSRTDIKVACDRSGALIGVEVKYQIDAGAYSTLSPVVLWRGAVHAAGAYSVPNVKIDAYALATNHVPCGAFRGFGSPQILFAVESELDELAKKVGLDPAEFRHKNLLNKGDLTATGYKIPGSCGLQETYDKALKQSNWKNLKKEFSGQKSSIKKGIGISTVFYGVGLGAGGKHLARTGAFLQIDADGSVQIAVGTTEMGQGMQTVLRQIAAQGLGISYEDVSILQVDTSRVPDSGPTVASRSTTMTGMAILDACGQALEVLTTAAAEMLKSDRSNVQFINGFCLVENEKKLKFSMVVKRCFALRMPMAFQGFASSPDTSWDPKTGQGKAYVVYSYATNVVKVAVNTKTGEITVEKIWAAHDVGQAINPAAVRGQIEGGSLQGLGYALMENMKTEGGRITNPDLATYMIPTAEDTPEISSIIVEHPFPEGPFGAKGFGEQPLMGIAPAITNAIYDAVGVRIYELPASAETVWGLLKNK